MGQPARKRAKERAPRRPVQVKGGIPLRVKRAQPRPLLHLVGEESAEKAPQGPRKPSEGAIVGPLTLSESILRIGGNLRPIDVSNIIREADTGYTARLMDLANEARQKDCHLQSVLFTRETALASLPWQVQPFAREGQQPKAKDQAISDWVQDRLSQLFGNAALNLGAPDDLVGLRSLFAHLAGAAYPGFAVSEVVWGRDQGDLVPIGFSLIQARRFLFRQSDGRLCWWDQGMGDPIDVMRAYAPGKFITHRPRINGDIPCREGLVRPLMWAALFRNWDIRDWLQLAELAWKPYRTGSYTRDSTQADRDNLIEMLKKMSTSGVGMFADTTKFMVEWPKHSVSSGQSMHGELAAFFGAEMSKCVLGQTLTTEAGQKGARALGEVHDEVRKDIADADAIQAAATVQSQLIGPMVRLNFGNDAKMPHFFFVTNETADIATFGDGILNLRRAGTKIPAKWVRDRVGMPIPDDKDEILGPVVENPAKADQQAEGLLPAGGSSDGTPQPAAPTP